MDYRDERSGEGEKRKREKRSRKRGLKGSLCMPSLKGRDASPVSLLERLRELMFRFIMISAISKGSTTETRTRRPGDGAVRRRCHPDTHHSEAIADCIEFFKKSATSPAEKEEAAGAGDGDDNAD
uniref:Uncharacterized protein n=1 Tax=Nymphaea colorata TaxID=210225 RepID=A0A5K1AE75_9MAGN